MVNKDQLIAYYVLLGIPLLVYAGFVLFPILVSVVLGFTSWKYNEFHHFSGIGNYIQIFSDVKFWWAFWHNWQIVIISVLGQIPLALFLAYTMHRKLIRGTNFFTTLIFLPITISSIVVALLWNRIFSPVGIYTSLIRSITGNSDYVVRIFENKQLAMLPVLFVILWMFTSLYLVIFIANMQRIPPTLFEAAVIDGASEAYIFIRIVVPILANVIFTCAVLAISGSLKSFDLIFAMTGGGPVDYTSVLATYMYDQSFTTGNLGLGSAISTVIALLSIGLIVFLRYIYRIAVARHGEQ